MFVQIWHAGVLHIPKPAHPPLSESTGISGSRLLIASISTMNKGGLFHLGTHSCILFPGHNAFAIHLHGILEANWLRDSIRRRLGVHDRVAQVAVDRY